MAGRQVTDAFPRTNGCAPIARILSCAIGGLLCVMLAAGNAGGYSTAFAQEAGESNGGILSEEEAMPQEADASESSEEPSALTDEQGEEASQSQDAEGLLSEQDTVYLPSEEANGILPSGYYVNIYDKQQLVNAAAKGGMYRLQANLVFGSDTTESIRVQGSLVLDMNDHTIGFDNCSMGSLFTVTATSSLVLGHRSMYGSDRIFNTNSKADRGANGAICVEENAKLSLNTTIDGGYSTNTIYGSAITARKGAQVTLDGIIKNCTCSFESAAVYLDCASLDFARGSINNCKTVSGTRVSNSVTAGAILFKGDGTGSAQVGIGEGAEIAYCEAPQGGAISVYDDAAEGIAPVSATFKGRIVNCKATERGGAVNVVQGTFCMKGGQISGCECPKTGSAISVDATGYTVHCAKAIIEDGSIEDCTAGTGTLFAKGERAFIEIKGGSIGQAQGSANKGSGADGALCLEEKAEVTMSGGILYSDQGTCTQSGCVRVNEGCSFILTGGTLDARVKNVKGETYEYRYGAAVRNSGTFTMTGGTIYGGSAVLGGTIFQEAGDLYLEAGSVYGGRALKMGQEEGYGGLLYQLDGTVSVSAKMTLSGGYADMNGGMFYQAGGSLALTCVTLSGSGGTDAKNDGGCIFQQGGDLRLDGCKITGFNAGNNGGALCVEPTKVLTHVTLAGSPTLANNEANKGKDVYIDYNGNGKVETSTNEDEAADAAAASGREALSVKGVTTEKGTVVIDTAEGFKPDTSQQMSVAMSDALGSGASILDGRIYCMFIYEGAAYASAFIDEEGGATGYRIGTTKDDEEAARSLVWLPSDSAYKTISNEAEFKAAFSNPDGGHYKVTNDFIWYANETLTVPKGKGMSIEFDGHRIVVLDRKCTGDCMISVSDGAKLALGEMCTNRGTAKTQGGFEHRGMRKESNVPFIKVSQNANLALDCLVTDIYRDTPLTVATAAVLDITQGAQVTMDRGIIDNCELVSNQRLINIVGGSLLIRGGAITNCRIQNSTARDTGLLFVSGEGGMLRMDAGLISDNAVGSSGIVNIQGKASFVMNGGRVADNGTSYDASAIKVGDDSLSSSGTTATASMVLNDGYLAGTKGSTGTRGSCVNVGANATFTMNGGTLAGGDAWGGGCLYTKGNSTIAGGTLTGETGEYEPNFGGLVYHYGGDLSLSNCTLIGGKAQLDGGAIESEGQGFYLNEGVVIRNCTAGRNGGALFLYPGRAVLASGSLIESCVATDCGGAIYSKSTLTCNAVIKNCSSKGCGGGIYQSKILRFGGSVQACSAEKSGGGIYLEPGASFYLWGTVSQCSAGANGGGVYVSDEGAMRISFEGKATVSDNKLGSGKASDLFLDSPRGTWSYRMECKSGFSGKILFDADTAKVAAAKRVLLCATSDKRYQSYLGASDSSQLKVTYYDRASATTEEAGQSEAEASAAGTDDAITQAGYYLEPVASRANANESEGGETADAGIEEAGAGMDSGAATKASSPAQTGDISSSALLLAAICAASAGLIACAAGKRGRKDG